jgi:uncharacterized membrane protein YoaK (UPF0700 family)
MATALGPFLVYVVLVFIGVFLMVAAYSRRPLLLRLATLGSLHIDPDHPGELPRAVMFGIGVTLVVVMIVLLLVDRLHAVGVL